MNRGEALNTLSIFLLEYRKEVINLINEQGLGSLTYNSKQSEVNRIVFENLYKKRFVEGLDDILRKENKGYLNDFGISTIIVIIVAVVASASAVNSSIKNRRADFENLVKEDRRNKYLTREELDTIEYYENRKMQNIVLETQMNYMLKKKTYLDAKEKGEKQNIAIMITGGVLVLIVANYMIKL
tara:strand:- start:7512 stop:8063 length:552 start_codon:yes stop_codon:yes gene_type:complete